MLNLEGFWRRITEAFGTDDVGEIATKVGRTYHAVYKWSTLDRPPRLEPETLAAIADLTNVSIDWLLTGRGSRTVSMGPGSGQVGEDAPVYLPDPERKIVHDLASDSGRDYSSQIRQLVIESLKNRGLVPDQPEPASLVFFGELTSKVKPMTLLGEIKAGKPIQTIEPAQTIRVAKEFATSGRRTFALRVQGDSMEADGISDGDLIICYESSDVEKGQFIVALVDGEATIKAFHREQDRIRLQPINKEGKPIFVEPERLQIQGVVMGIQRRRGNWK